MCDLCVQYGLRKCVTLFTSSEEKVGTTVTDIIQDIKCSWMENHAVDNPGGKRSHVECFSVVRSCEGKVLGTDSNEKTYAAYYIAFYCLFLYCILLSTGFTVRKLYYVSILFYYASVFDFPKYKKLYIALCYGRKYFLP